MIGDQTTLTEDAISGTEEPNDFANALRDELREWREGTGRWAGKSYEGTALVTRCLLEWWFERDEERRATFQRFFFCQREAVEAVIYLYEVKNHHRMPETEDLIRYALKMATGTGKTIVMGLLIVWSTLHKAKVSGSSLSNNILVLVPNLTVRDRITGIPRGDGLDPAGSENLYDTFDMIPPEYMNDFHPNIVVRNWQAVPLEANRDDWISDGVQDEGRFLPASVIWALQRRARQNPYAAIRRVIGKWKDLIIINDEAHHVYGEKRTRKGKESDYIKWNKIIDHIAKCAHICLAMDLSATPWYGSGSPKPEGTLFEWLISDFSVYDSFESGLVKIVRLPEQTGAGRIYLDLWEGVKGAKTKEEYISACKGAIASMYASWKEDFNDWSSKLEAFGELRNRTALLESYRGACPVMLVVASDATKAAWLFEHLNSDYSLLRNPDNPDPTKWVTIQVDSKVFDAEKGLEGLKRHIVSTVGRKGMPGENVRCIISVNMLSEGWDVKNVTHILGVRAFGSDLLTEQVIGRGLRLQHYDVLNQPFDERPEGSEEYVDAFGIPFIGFPVQKRRRPKAGEWGQKAEPIEKDSMKVEFRIRVPNVRSWAVGITEPLSKLLIASQLPELQINPKDTPPEVKVRPLIGGKPEGIMTLNEFRKEWPILRTAFLMAQELLHKISPPDSSGLQIGPTFDELLESVQDYIALRLIAIGTSDKRDIGIYYWRLRLLNILETAIRSSGPTGSKQLPILGHPEFLDTEEMRRFQWTGIRLNGKKTHLNKVPCHTDLEKQFTEFLDRASDILRYVKNERYGFSVTYYEANRPRQYFPDFIVVSRDDSGSEIHWLIETKGEIRSNTAVKAEAARIWCDRMSRTKYGTWRYILIPQRFFERAIESGVKTYVMLLDNLTKEDPSSLAYNQ